ncbi:MAG: N-acetyl-gamma-glutamyl-phosphate reductase [Kiritimatiellae bacterium]|nr:N-acetyl-gamma-glutamyl-phosphate reductase [Kiritimatiellia bacterium]
MIKAKIIGAGGYGGVGISELLISHPEVEIGALVDIDNTGTPISDLYPHLKGFLDTEIVSAVDAEKENYDVVFMATPDGVGMSLAEAETQKGTKVIDYSGDFRFNTLQSYAEYATRIGRPATHSAEQLLADAVYGLPELHRNEISSETSVIGNPGCFAVSCILGLAPAMNESLVRLDSIICDCKTGVSGAGKKPSPAFHYPARYDAMNAYKLAGHQHVCEIERELGLAAQKELKVTFTAQVVPLCRGIMSTLYGTLMEETTEDAVLDIYKNYYKDDVFVRVFDGETALTSAQVRGTNYCNITVSVDKTTRRLRIVSYIDNLVKGQAGSALQNMNLLFGFPETLGLDRPGMYP